MTEPASAADQHHHNELARAAAAAMQQHYQEAIDICAELLTSGTYEQWEQQDKEAASAARAETRLIMASAMHYAEANYKDLVRVLTAALDSPPEIQKDAYFTLALVHLSFDHPAEAAEAIQKCLTLIEELRSRGPHKEALEALDRQEQEAKQMLNEIASHGGGESVQ